MEQMAVPAAVVPSLRPSFLISQHQEVTVLNCAILDDYKNCALRFADWSSLDGVQVKNFTDAITTPDTSARGAA